MRRDLAQMTFPGSAALRAFESAGRLGSFKRAAVELKLTESAISHQIRRLERDLGHELFVRGHRQVKLTPAGRAYLDVVQQAHRDILGATLSLDGSGSALVRLSLLPALAQYWLVPRLGRLRERLGSVNVAVFVSSDLVDLDRDEIDLAIRYGTGTWPRARVQHLMDEMTFPVAAPSLARRLGRNGIAASGLPLIQNLQHPEEWAPWLAATLPRDLIRLESSPLVLETAKAGLGIAIGRRPFVDNLLLDGSLKKIGQDELPSGKGHFLLSAAGRAANRPAIRAVIDALLELAETR
ncbi:LysR family glycine cleavage system transcriptional activator [Dongia mobilis]|uniref:LysR family glycine cleavage system transcriptional activator n=1 Tax=Dongia mobilis TaxID=578943 RepID=A0A4R6WUM9_9PROT|nr:LysR substrate-binding domain-containing protein [Dongia mobilis]TDQ83383.1 LysR family glycine cleavage system transcriptional activator [Dongia mobilis]